MLKTTVSFMTNFFDKFKIQTYFTLGTFDLFPHKIMLSHGCNLILLLLLCYSFHDFFFFDRQTANFIKKEEPRRQTRSLRGVN